MSHLGGEGDDGAAVVVLLAPRERENRRPAWSYWVRGWGRRKETRAEWKVVSGEVLVSVVGWGIVGALGLWRGWLVAVR